MNKSFFLIVSYFLLVVHFNTARAQRSQDELSHGYVNLTGSDGNITRGIVTLHKDKSKENKLIKRSFLQYNTLSNRSSSSPCVGDDCFCQNFYDLTLIIDESGSIGTTNWEKYVIPFTEKIIKDLYISNDDVHVGILLFSISNRDYVTFDDNESYDKDALLKKVDKLKKQYAAGGGTKIVEALKYSLEKYTYHKKGRKNAPKVTILFTDGNDSSSNSSKLLDMGLTYRKENVKLLVLGVASASDINLKLIAGCSDKNAHCPYSMKAEWETINDITKKLTNKICHTEQEDDSEPEEGGTAAPQPNPCQGDDCFCEDYYDLTLILDESGSITLNKWKVDVVPFAEKVLSNLNISKNNIHVGIMRFAVRVVEDVGYGQETRYDKNALINVVKGLKNKYGSGKGTHIVDALEHSLANFTRHPNNRPNAPKVTILFTDGNENHKRSSDVRDIGLKYRKENIRLIVVGVYKATTKSLKMLAGCKENEPCPQVIKCDWNELTSITKVITDKICDIDSGELPGSSENPGSSGNDTNPDYTPCTNWDDCYCKNFYDITLILDESASIGDFRWNNEVVPFAKEIVYGLNVGYSTVHVGILLFADSRRDIVRFTDTMRYDKSILMQKIHDLKGDYTNGKKTFLIQALTYALESYTKNSSRPKAPKVTMLFTDGNDSSESNQGLYNIGLAYRKEKVKLLILGVSMADENKLKLLAGCTRDSNCPFVIKVEWGQLHNVSSELVRRICSTGPIIPPEITPPEVSSPEITPPEVSSPEIIPPEVSSPEIEPPSPCIGDECLCHNIYDLTLILDESASIGSSNWKKQVYPFVEKLVKHLEISESKVHVGIMLFAKHMRDFVKFSDKESYEMNSLMKKFPDLEKTYKAGSYTYIVESLQHALQHYTKGVNSRLDVPKVTILFTDGNDSRSGDDALSNVSLLYKKENVKLLVVGVGAASMHKLRLLGGCHKTEGDCPFAIKIEWDKLKDISKGMVDKICNTEAEIETTPETETTPCEGNDDCFCKDYFDLTFIGAPSTKKNYKRKNELTKYVTKIINKFNIAKQHVHVSLSIHLKAKTVNTDFNDEIAHNKKELLKVLEVMDSENLNNKTNIAEALEVGLKQSFSNGNRGKAPKIAILLTNSNNDISEQAMLQNISKKYADKKVKLLVVGVGKLPKEILFIAAGCNLDSNENTCPHVFISTGFSYINSVEKFLKKNVCDKVGDDGTQQVNPPLPDPNVPCDDDESCEECDDDVCNNNPTCKKAFDIAIVLDQSRNISNEQWKMYVKPFTIHTVKQNYLSKYRTHVTIVKMSRTANVLWKLDRKVSYKKNKMIKRIKKLIKSSSIKKDIANNLKYLREKVFNKTPSNKRKLIIMLVEGKSNTDLNELRREIELLKINKIDIFVYAIDNIDEKEYRILGDCEKSSSSSSSSVVCKNIVKVTWDKLLPAVDIHNNYICNQYPEDAECSEWGEWSPCQEASSCDNLAVSKRERKGPPYTVKEEGFLGDMHGSSCVDLGSIEYRSCPIKEECNDICGDFGEWSQCNATCGDGIRTRHRDTSSSSSDDESCTVFNATEVEACNIQDCDSTEVCEDVGEWSEWTACSKTCGYSTRRRTFTIFPEDIDEYADCKNFKKTEMEVCSVPACEDEKCFEWEEWTEWSATCGPRKRVQRARRLFTRVSSGTGANKTGVATYPAGFTLDSRNDNNVNNPSDECEIHYENKIERDDESASSPPCTNNPCGSWSEWSECDRTCNTGMRTRRFISNVTDFTGDDKSLCLEYHNEIETEPCLNLPLCDEGECNDWETWVECKTEESPSSSSSSLSPSSSCHAPPRKRTLTRKLELLKNKKENTSKICNDYKLFREEECPVFDNAAPCINALCNEWEEWEDCSATCGKESFRIRRRKEPLELIPPSEDMNGNMGLTCEQQNIKIEEKEACNVPDCGTPGAGNGGGNGQNNNNSNGEGSSKGMGTAEKVSLAAGVIGLAALGVGGLIYGYNALSGGEVPHNSNMEFENVESDGGEVEKSNEDFEVIDANDPMWN
ncbi:circumsporozoite- and TRAP-related protein [Plasmodium gonderi]|uniref:Circumsporozoite-and TRAP-related protein n=1 Tax=Plasmodium gonderi TaxID=77519 RepID=A0A1Y1JDS6_PLAGO|nr:circumsporozoite- and TRAP-related protein [Plasmodium gonderi]GAW80671.1 circumsporozoite- and TRAP-related protein [Plasmodium gonderi]